MPDILHRLTIHAPSERVFEALTRLQQYVETGKGAPHPDKDFARIIY